MRVVTAYSTISISVIKVSADSTISTISSSVQVVSTDPIVSADITISTSGSRTLNTHYINTPMQHTAILRLWKWYFLTEKNDIFLNFAKDYTLQVLVRTANLCVGAKIRKMMSNEAILINTHHLCLKTKQSEN